MIKPKIGGPLTKDNIYKKYTGPDIDEKSRPDNVFTREEVINFYRRLEKFDVLNIKEAKK